jgi:isoleucyl-tRNA synthetase
MSEAYDCMPFKAAEDVYLTNMPEYEEINDELEEKYDEFMKYRDLVLKALEDARAAKVIGKSFGAKLILTLDKKAEEVFAPVKDNAATLLIVSQLEFKAGDEFKVEVLPAEGCTCARCRMIVPFVSVDELCPRWEKIVNNK